MEIEDSATFKFKYFFSIQHIQSAILFANMSRQLEKIYNGKNNEAELFNNKSYVMATIFSSVAFLEANVNELWETKIDKNSIPFKASILEKYEILTGQFKGTIAEKGRTPYQDVHILITLRNALIHYEPIFVSPEDKHLFSTLESKFLPSKLFMETKNPFYPDKCLGFGCAEWAIKKSIQFSDDFFSRIKIPATYEHIRDMLIDYK